MRIIVDAMGSDSCPAPDVEGAFLAARELREQGSENTIALVGDQKRVEAELAKYEWQGLNIEIIHTDQHIDMHDKASRVARTKPRASMKIGMEMVGTQQADAFVTAGNTGAALALATLHTLRRIPGVMRPALTSLVRVENEQLVVLVDLGANADSRPEWLVQFGVMGSLYAQHVLGQKRPRVGLLSNGEEEGKGNKLVRDTADMFPKAAVNFIGNIEPKEVLQGKADVVVSDGFVGNIMLKTLEALGDSFFRVLRRELTLNPLRILGALLTKPALRKIYKQVDPFEIGGAPLLGVNGVVIVAHGRTNAKGIKNAVWQAHNAVKADVISVLRAGMAPYAVATGTEVEDPVATADIIAPRRRRRYSMGLRRLKVFRFRWRRRPRPRKPRMRRRLDALG
jgi:phosphate acyltransferase